MHWCPLQAQIQVCLSGHTIYPVIVLRLAALMQRPGCEPESLIATQRRPVAKKNILCDCSMLKSKPIYHIKRPHPLFCASYDEKHE